MADDKMQDNSNVSQPHEQVTPGELLRRAREAAGMTRDDLGGRLQLHPRTMAALEEDHFDALPEPPFVRGYLRGLAKVLEIDPAPLVEAYESSVRGGVEASAEKSRGATRSTAQGVPERHAQAGPKTAPASARQVAVGPIWIVLAGLVLVGVLAAVVWYVNTLEEGEAADATASAPSGVQEAPGDEPEAIASAPSLRESPPQPANARSESPEQRASAQAPEAPVPAEPEPAPAPPEPVSEAQERAAPDLPAGQGRLELRFEEDSWVEISGADGGRLLVGLMRQGSERRIEGATPIRVFLGNAPGVRLEYNHEPVDLEGRVRGDNTARFTVGDS
ncbi:hypothetical protein ECTOBSL9_3184 [Ectothiorhodospira sp. BSL-9]|nr:hypothetical protein ECTOBSL9_3184 [Ectothiorhodospira sp. BSL-9]